jgi:hypothetical protein
MPSLDSVIDIAFENFNNSKNGAERGLFLVALAIAHHAAATRYAAYTLGTADAATPMGALESIAKELHDGADSIASALHAIADREG